jgi:hypothetical protein
MSSRQKPKRFTEKKVPKPVSIFRSNAFYFFLSFLIAISLWLLVKLSDQYIAIVEYPLDYTNLPPQYKLTAQPQKSLQVTLSGQGHYLLVPSFFTPKKGSIIDLSRWVSSKGLKSTRLFPEIRSHFPHLKIVDVQPSNIPLSLKRKVSKRVPITSKVRLFTYEGYMLTDSLRFIPDSVELIGTTAEIQPYGNWNTEAINVEQLSDVDSISIPLQASNQINIYPKVVKAFYKATRFVEGTIDIRIKVVNKPLDYQIQLMPEYISLRYMMPINKFVQISPEQVQAVVDYSTLDPQSSYCLPEINIKVADCRPVFTNPAFIRYLITTNQTP